MEIPYRYMDNDYSFKGIVQLAKSKKIVLIGCCPVFMFNMQNGTTITVTQDDFRNAPNLKDKTTKSLQRKYYNIILLVLCAQLPNPCRGQSIIARYGKNHKSMTTIMCHFNLRFPSQSNIETYFEIMYGN